MIEKDSRQEIGEYVFLSKYAQTHNGKKESWQEAVNRVMNMHITHYSSRIKKEDEKAFSNYVMGAYNLYSSQHILGAQRALQFGGDSLIEKHSRMYNCSSTYIDRITVFKEIMYLLLSGAGTGYSVQSCHISKLPIPRGFDYNKDIIKFTIPDSIEGWSEAVGVLFDSYFKGYGDVEFDYSEIRPKGAHIRGGFKAPGHEPLKEALDKIKNIMITHKGRKLRPFEVHYLICILANSVVTGGVRRSAMISIFDVDDLEMANCKTGDWFTKMPELCRSNNSAAILPHTTQTQFNRLFNSTKKYGEPGFVFIDSEDFVYNPCGEVGMFPKIKDEYGVSHSGWSFCNLAEINGGKMTTEEEFYSACESAAFICTLQAGYTDFDILEKYSKQIADRDALIGVGITGMCENPSILFNPEIQKKGAEIVKATNIAVAKIIGINPAARTTVIKPSGNSSQMLGTLSGITLGHSKHYIRHIQAASTEQTVQEWERVNPCMVEKSVWSPEREKVIAFPVTLPKDTLFKENYSAVDFLKLVLLTKQNWIENGTNFDHPSSIENPKLRMNVSNTCTVKPDEWDSVKEFIWQHRAEFGGISLLSSTGDLDYPQAPFTEVLTETELSDRYGAGAILSSGLIVDAQKVFADVWEACNVALGYAPNMLSVSDSEIGEYVSNNIKDGKFLVDIDGICFSDVNCVIDFLKRRANKRVDWVRRFEAFASKYMNNDIIKTTYCLKHVNAYHKWQALNRAKKVNYDKIEWEDSIKEAGSDIATACAGGACSI